MTFLEPYIENGYSVIVGGEQTKKLVLKNHPTANVFVFNEDDLDLEIKLDEISYDLNSEIPKLYIKGEEVGVVSMTRHYITTSMELATNVTTFVYVTKNRPEQKILSIDHVNEELFQQ